MLKNKIFLEFQHLKEKIGNNNLAYTLHIISCLSWVFSFIYAIDYQFNPMETLLARGLGSIGLNYSVIRFLDLPLKIHNSHSFKYFNRIAIFNIQGYLVFALCQLYVSLPIVHTLNSTSIVMVSLIDYLIYHSKVNKGARIGIILSLTGVVILANNKYLSGNQETEKHLRVVSTAIVSLLCLLLFVSRTMFCYGLVIMKEIKHISSVELNFIFDIYGIFIGSIGYMFVENPKPLEVFLPGIFFIGFFQFFCYNLFLLSISVADRVGNVMIVNSFNIIFSFVFSIFYYQESVNSFAVIGSILIILSTVALTYWK